MNGLPMGAQAPAAPPQQQDPNTIDVSKMDIGAMLAEKLHLDESMLDELKEALLQVSTPEEAMMVLKQFDRNPETMNDKYDPVAQAQGAPAPAPAGLPIGQ